MQRNAMFLLLFFLLFPILTQAQTTWEKTWLEPSVDWPTFSQHADVDGDGDLDEIILGDNEELTWWENQNTTFVRHLIREGREDLNYTSFFPGDLDGDGDMDFLILDEEENRLFAFLQSEFGWNDELVGHNLDNVSVFRVVDLDGDGFDDIVAAQSNQGDNEFLWIESHGGGWVQHPINTDLPARQMALADMDGDGDTDVACCRNNGNTFFWMEWNGSTFIPHEIGAYSFSTDHPILCMDAADYDLDGDMDLLFAGYVFVALLVHEGDDWNIDWVESSFNQGIDKAAFANVDDDPEPEILASDFYGIDRWDRSGDTWTWYMIIPEGSMHDLEICDLDGDSDLDVLGLIFGVDRMPWYENDEGSWIKHFITSDVSSLSDFQVADIDNDGDQDLITAVASERKLLTYENLPGPDLARHDLDTGWLMHPKWLRVADMDLDGDLDFVTADVTTDDIKWYENTGADYLQHDISDGFGNIHSFETVDLGANFTMLGLVVVTENSRVYLVFKAGGSWNRTTVAHCQDLQKAIPADLDNDGDQDLILASLATDPSEKFLWLEYTGPGQPMTRHTIANLYNAGSVEPVDMDSDGDLDILASGNAGAIPVTWLENTDGIDWTPHTAGGLGVTGKRVLPRDLDGDGDVDILTAAIDEDACGFGWIEQTGVDQWTAHVIDTNMHAIVAMEALDLDEDGDLDIVATIDHGETAIWWQENNRFVADYSGTAITAESSARCQIHPNPFNAATTIKINLLEQQPVRVAVYDILGRQVTVLADGPMSPGAHNFTFDASKLSSGVYFVRVAGPEQTRTQRITLVK